MKSATAGPRWWERDAVRIWAPLAAVLAACLQTFAYAGYQGFYGEFGVDASEVGIDYSSILKRTATPLALSLVAVVVLLAFIGLVVPAGIALWRSGRESERDRELQRAYPARGGRGILLFCVWLLLVRIVAPLTDGVATLIALLAVTTLAICTDAWFAKRGGEPSTLSLFLEPRLQGGFRHLLVLTLAVLAGAAVGEGWLALLVVGPAIFWIDRSLSPPTGTAPPPPFTERLRRLPLWFVSMFTLLVAAGVAFILVLQLDWTLQVAHLEKKIGLVRAGGELPFSPFAPFGLIQPQARRVTVRWLAQEPPRLFLDPMGNRRPVALTFFGEGSGRAVFFDPQSRTVVRVPSGSVYMESQVGEIP